MSSFPEHPHPCLSVVFVSTAQGPMVPLVLKRKGLHEWWDLPGGKRRLHENALDGARREVREEINLHTRIVAYLGAAPHPIRAGHERHFFAAERLWGRLKNMEPVEHAEVKLFTPGDAAGLLTTRVPESVMGYLTKDWAPV